MFIFWNKDHFVFQVFVCRCRELYVGVFATGGSSAMSGAALGCRCPQLCPCPNPLLGGISEDLHLWGVFLSLLMYVYGSQ